MRIPAAKTHTTPALEAIALHRLLTTEQVRRLTVPGRSSGTARAVLNALKDEGLIDCTRDKLDDIKPAMPQVWWATERGLEAATKTLKGERLTLLESPGERTHTHLHTLAVNEVCISAVEAARTRGVAAEWRNESGHSLGKGQTWTSADAHIRLDPTPEARLSPTRNYLLELDRDSKIYDRIVAQHRAWDRYRKAPNAKGTGPIWAGRYEHRPDVHGAGFPTILWVFDGSASQGRSERFCDLITDANLNRDLQSGGLPTLVTTLERLRAGGVMGPVFRDPHADQARRIANKPTYPKDIYGISWATTGLTHADLPWRPGTIDSHIEDRLAALRWPDHERRLRATDARAAYLARINDRLPSGTQLCGDGNIYYRASASAPPDDLDAVIAAIEEPATAYPARRTRQRRVVAATTGDYSA